MESIINMLEEDILKVLEKQNLECCRIEYDENESILSMTVKNISQFEKIGNK
jgi:hypothetical protein